MSKKINCPVCSTNHYQIFHELVNIPAHIGILWNSRSEALNCPKGNIKLAFCHDCGLIWNLEFDEQLMLYSGPYDNSLHFSPTYQDYAKSVANQLIKKYRIFDKTIIEIGSGRGDFLSLLCHEGNNTGIGFDPSFDGNPIDDRITLIKDYYTEKYINYKGDLVCSRYVLEHISKPMDFMKLVRGVIGQNNKTILFFEVPNVSLILKNLSVWDIIYEHCSYFGLTSLENVFNRAEFDSLAVYETYENQFVCIEASPTNGTGSSLIEDFKYLQELSTYVNRFSHYYTDIILEWKDKFNKFKVDGKSTVIWGAGAKGVSFLNMLDLKDEIQYVVDINPRKKRHFIPGTGHEIVSPDELSQYKPDNIIIMNPIYKNEIEEKLSELKLTSNLFLAS
jgi:hypothetical protein